MSRMSMGERFIPVEKPGGHEVTPSILQWGNSFVDKPVGIKHTGKIDKQYEILGCPRNKIRINRQQQSISWPLSWGGLKFCPSPGMAQEIQCTNGPTKVVILKHPIVRPNMFHNFQSLVYPNKSQL